MSDFKQSLHGTPPTLAEYREWERTATRPLTDSPIGSSTAANRSIAAKRSRLVDPANPERERVTR